MKPGSMGEAIIADWIDNNMGIQMTTEMINSHIENEVLETVSQSIIVRHYNKMK